MRISDWSSDVCSSDLTAGPAGQRSREVMPEDLEVASGPRMSDRHGPATGTAAEDHHGTTADRLRPAARSRPVARPRHRRAAGARPPRLGLRSEEHTSELQSLMRTSYAVFCLKK